jgi:hypothetical protein
VNNNCTEYWDGGRKRINEFLEEHSEACKNNWICRSLNLDDTTVVEPKSPDEGTKRRQALYEAAARKRHKLSYVLLEPESGDGN